MSNNGYVQDGQVYPDETAAVVANHPSIPEDIKRLYVSPALKEGQGGAIQSQATQVPADENNAPAASVEALRPLLDVGNGELPEWLTNPTGFSEGTQVGNAISQRNEDVIKESLRKTFEALKLPGDVSQGNVPMWAQDENGEIKTSPDVIKRAADLAQIAVQGPAPLAGKLADGTLGSFAGVKAAKPANKLADLGHAQVLESDMVHPDKVYQQTGFFRGPDNRWRFEIDDSKSKFKPEWYNKEYKPKLEPTDPLEQVPFDFNEGKVQTTLGKILDHPELYKAYPDLKNMKVVKDNVVKTAQYAPTLDQISVGPEQYNTHGVMMHEIQHAIQEREGFARGGAPGEAGKTYQLRLAKEAQKQIKEPLKTMYKKLTDMQAVGERVPIEDINEYLRLTGLAAKYNEYAKAGDKQAYLHYLELAGEVEARNTDTRLLLTDKERRQLAPKWTEDTDRPIVQMKSVTTSPYGAGTFKTGTSRAPEIPFRRAANDNESPADFVKRFKEDLPKYREQDPSVIDLLKKYLEDNPD